MVYVRSSVFFSLLFFVFASSLLASLVIIGLLYFARRFVMVALIAILVAPCFKSFLSAATTTLIETFEGISHIRGFTLAGSLIPAGNLIIFRLTGLGLMIQYRVLL